MKLMVGNLEQELKNERKCIKEELARKKKLKKDLEEEAGSRQVQQQELENQASRDRNIRCRERKARRL